ncbi:urea amidolyase associated protein UAAP1 [Neobacillus cucumis]|uniref:Urea carboxylase n=1 Tax=Neobacillus cucumis TaxID=1740721 RepID=A0A2N5HIU7_9BACI|nr:urea amidolyase associated protein UAAP1 [Neobacillus cucumis]PLS05446.1 urea carboxylase [Neobacillus cucumis]
MNTVLPFISKMIPAGGKWSGQLSQGKQITFTALEEGANVSLLLYNANDSAERYNMPDTLKAQHTAHLTKGNVLMSDNGRVLASIVEDSLGWHDTISGYTSRALTNQKYGISTYQNQRNDYYKSGEENFSVELFRNGLTTRDLSPVVNLFSKVFCDLEGNLHYVSKHSKKGDTVTLRTEMDVILVLSNTPNPLNPDKACPSVPVELTITEADPIQGNDICLNHRPENRRAFENTWEYVLLSKGGIR